MSKLLHATHAIGALAVFERRQLPLAPLALPLDLRQFFGLGFGGVRGRLLGLFRLGGLRLLGFLFWLWWRFGISFGLLGGFLLGGDFGFRPAPCPAGYQALCACP